MSINQGALFRVVVMAPFLVLSYLHLLSQLRLAAKRLSPVLSSAAYYFIGDHGQQALPSLLLVK